MGGGKLKIARVVVRDSRFESVHAMVHAVSVKRVKLTVEYI